MKTLAWLLLALLPSSAMSQTVSATEDLSLTRLYRLPWVVGTTPEKPLWSPDSRHVAFLWNDDGGNTRDLWWTAVTGGSAERLTDIRRPRVTTPADPNDARQAEARRESDAGITGFTFSADAQSIYYSRSGTLYRLGLPPTPDTRIADATASGVHDLAAVPRSSGVVYAHSQGLSVLDGATSTEPRRLVNTPSDVMIDTLKVSPDGRQVAFIETDLRPIRERVLPDYLTDETSTSTIRRAFPGEPSEHYRVGVVSLAGGAPVWMALEGNPEDLVFSISWSPDGQTLLVDRADLYIKHRWIRLLNPKDGQGRTFYEERDEHNVTAEWWADWAADGRSLYLTSDRGEDYQLWQLPLDGHPARALTSDRYAVFSASVLPRARGVLVIANRERAEDRTPYWVDTRGRLFPLSDRPGYHEPFASPDGAWLAEIDSDDVTPPELYLRPFHTHGDIAPAQRVTHSPQAGFEHTAWAKARYVDFSNVHDGTSIHARLTLPPDFDPHGHYPAIIGSVYSNTAHNRWGGRVYHPTWALDQVLARRGYVIMNVDIRGSSGHGKRFRQQIGEDYGGVDVEDLYSATRYLVGTGFVDEHRIGIWGSSYGGLLTTMSLFKHPGTYAAGVAGAPATNVFHAETGEMRTMMDPTSRAQRYRAASPFLYSDGLQDPLLLIHGMRDDTVLFKDTLVLAQRLLLADKDFEIAVLPDAPHGWDTQGLAQTRYAFRRLVEFFDRHLRPGTTH